MDEARLQLLIDKQDITESILRYASGIDDELMFTNCLDAIVAAVRDGRVSEQQLLDSASWRATSPKRPFARCPRRWSCWTATCA